MVRRIAALALLLAAIPTPARAGDPALDWRTIDTPHFSVQFYQPNDDIARRVAVLAERAHRVLAPVLRHVPDERTIITITDDTDSANGFAGALPRNQIGLFATAPDALSVLGDHDDWLYTLVAHEYTHILHLDTIRGLPRLYNDIFGKRWSPNGIQPRWFIEGLATYEETRRTSGGRMRSALFEMFLRVPVLAGKPIDLDSLSNGPYVWPHGHAAYLYGGFFLEWLADRYGDDAIARISLEYGSQPIPWGLSRAVRRAVGQDYPTLYQQWMDHLRARYRLQKAAVERRGLITGTALTSTGEVNSSPRWTQDGDIVWLQHDGRQHGGYRRLDAKGRARALPKLDGAGRFSLARSGGLVAERFTAVRTYYSFSDLFRLDLDGTITRLTHGARAAAPDLSPDGKRLACTINGGARQRLAIIEMAAEAKPDVIWEGNRWDRAYDPAWSPDGESVVFSAWTEGGSVDLYLWQRATRTVRRLTHDRALDVTPRFAPDGEHVYFASDRTGIYNVYRLALDGGALDQVTNVLGGAFSPDVSPDGKRLVYSGFDGDGYELYSLELEPRRFLVPEPYLDDRPDPVRISDGELPPTRSRPYRAVETLPPRTWTVSTTLATFRRAISVSTGGWDVIGRHGWFLGTTVGLERGDVSFGGSYSLTKFWPGLAISGARSVGVAGGLIVDGRPANYHAETWGASASVFLPVMRQPEVYSDLSLAYDISWHRNLDPLPTPDPQMAVTIPPETGVFAGVTLRWFLSDVRGFVYSLGPVEGRGVSLAARLDHPSLGADARGVQLFWRWDQYQALPWWSHVLALRLQGGVGASERPGGVQFFLGGVPNQDIVSAVINSTREGTGWLRGYPYASLSGSQFHLLNAEYRVPLVDIDRGVSTLPLYVRRLHLAALFDVGNAFDSFDLGNLKTAVGVALRLDMIFGFYVPGSFDVGWARGLSEGGQHEFWLLLTGGL